VAEVLDERPADIAGGDEQGLLDDQPSVQPGITT
jgi:hypothetical protein